MPTPEDSSLSLLDREPSSLPANRRLKKSKLTPCRFCLGLVLVFVAAFFGLFLYQLGKLAYTFVGNARFPHLAHHHLPLKNETGRVFGEDELVRSFYGRQEDGGVEKFDLIATIFHRVMVKNETLEVGVEEGAMMLKEGEDELEKTRKKRKDELVWGPWERIFSEVVLDGLDLKTKRTKTIAKIKLPGRIIPSLRNSTQRVDLVASFNLIPSSLSTPNDLIPIDAAYYIPLNASTRTFPSPWPVLGNTLQAQRETEQTTASWRDQLVRYATIQPLLKEVIPWVENKDGEEKKDGVGITMVVNGERNQAGNEEEEGDGEKKEKKKEKTKSHAIVTRSMVTMVRDTSVYSLTSFKKQMKALGKSQQICNDLSAGKRVNLKGGKFPNCRDLLRFGGHGHFQSLFEMGSEEDAALLKEERERKSVEMVEGQEERKKGEKGWRYGAFIQANAGFPGPADLLELGNGTNEVVEEEPDLTFDWHLTFSTSSPFTVALAKAFVNGGDGPNDGVSSNRSAHEIARGQDTAEFFSASSTLSPLSSLSLDSLPPPPPSDLSPFSPNSDALLGHPFNPSSRPLVRKALRNLSSILTFFSTLIQLHFWITRNVTTGLSAPALAIDGLVTFIFSLWQGILDYREIDPLLFWSGTVVLTSYSAIIWALALRIEFSWWGYFPVGFSKRKASHLERASARVDMRFSWKQRGMASLLLLALSLLIPKLPYIIHASPPLSLVPEEGSLRSSIAKAWYFVYLNHLVNASSNLLFLSQYLLNQRSKTFGQNYRVLAGVDFLSQTLHALPVLLNKRWGRWELMDPLDVWDVVTMGRCAASAWQAWKFVEVKQEEEEEE